MNPSRPGFLVCISVALACADSPIPDVPPAEVRDSAGVRIVESRLPTSDTAWRVDAEPSLTIGRAEGDRDYELFQVTGAVRLSGGSVVVANSGTLELRFYDRSGTHMLTVGGGGGGPGEFQSLEWLSHFTADSIVVLDVAGHRVSVFDSAGRFGRSVWLQPSAEIPAPWPVGFFSDGSMLATHGLYSLGGELPIRSVRDEETLFRYAADGATASRVGSFPGRERDIVVIRRPNGAASVERWPRILGRATAYAAAGDRFYVADNSTYEVKVYSMDPPELKMLIRKEHQRLTATEADVRFVQDSMLQSRTGPARRMMEISFENRPPPPAAMPAFAPHIHIDSEHNLWVREYNRPGDQRVTWSVFSADGLFVTAVQTPIGVRILDIGSDYVLGLRHDEHDVEYVELFHLLKRN